MICNARSKWPRAESKISPLIIMLKGSSSQKNHKNQRKLRCVFTNSRDNTKRKIKIKNYDSGKVTLKKHIIILSEGLYNSSSHWNAREWMGAQDKRFVTKTVWASSSTVTAGWALVSVGPLRCVNIQGHKNLSVNMFCSTIFSEQCGDLQYKI